MDHQRIKAALEGAVAAERFNMTGLFGEITHALAGSAILKQLDTISPLVGGPVSLYLLKGIVRTAFLIELVKVPKIETTKFEVRWGDRLDHSDPRRADYQECFTILDDSVNNLAGLMQDMEWRQLLGLFGSISLLPYEIPLDYKDRDVKGSIHNHTNVSWAKDEAVQKAMRLRAFLLDGKNPYAKLFRLAYDKIQVKTYLTDRVLTGAHKTNREKRWETHPASVHFALRRVCLGTEAMLIDQLCRFEHFPTDLKTSLDKAELVSPGDGFFRCPITMEPLSFREFEHEIRDPVHGKASFQVGHLNPLKAINDDEKVGHNASNISWISSEGNRIQGSLSLSDTRALLTRIYANYRKFGIIK